MTRLASTLALAAAALAGARGTALAHGPDAIFDPLTMDPYAPVSKLDVDFGYVRYDEPDNVDYTFLGLTLGGQYVTPQGVGGYLTIPMSYVSVEGTVNIPPFPPITSSDSELSLGNLEIGGVFSKYFTAHSAVVLHAGLALPTAKFDAGEDGLATGLQRFASAPRYGQLVQRIPNSSWLRLGVSPMGRTGKLFWRADVGLDLALDEDDTDLSPVFRINVGGGLDLRTAHLLVEYVTNVTDEEGDEVTSTLALGVRLVSGNLRPGFALLLPVDFEGSAEPEFAIAASLSARL